MGVSMETRELETGWITINSAVEHGVLYAIQAEVTLYGVAWFSMNINGADELKLQLVPTGNVRTKEVASKDLSSGSA
ncbi:hypothetical protein M199_gp156 [Halogranum tailed virus 1]|uniref:Uncharacterized protein n=1 Tax=Halogranum tailed virus 1 TaxID=1273749 RepID=R4T9B8_9CAUD|nr:hypothetical protein M199_gp156 [Halogranum tailed virus 1]AGM11510.1 hypothetical protein HGTV1_213 [Halogranum tailed virus 1]